MMNIIMYHHQYCAAMLFLSHWLSAIATVQLFLALLKPQNRSVVVRNVAIWA